MTSLKEAAENVPASAVMSLRKPMIASAILASSTPRSRLAMAAAFFT